MADFKATAGDLDEIVRLRVRQSVRQHALYPVGALLVAGATAPLFVSVSLVALGAAGAWAFWLYRYLKDMKAAYSWRYAWLQEGVSVEIRPDGLQCTSARGTGLIRWRADIKLRALETCFVLEDEGEDVVVLPKKYLNTSELVMLNSRCGTS